MKSPGCKHLNDTVAIAQIQNTTGFAVRHHHNPVHNKVKGDLLSNIESNINQNITPSDTSKKKVTKKKKPFSGVKVSQMLAAREAEKQRINQVSHNCQQASSF